MKVYLNDPIAPSAVERLKRYVELVDNFDHPEELDAIIVRQQYCHGDVIRKATRCKLIQQHGVGLDRIDVEAAKEAGISVKNTPGSNARSVAEFAVAMMLDLSRKVNYIENPCCSAAQIRDARDSRHRDEREKARADWKRAYCARGRTDRKRRLSHGSVLL